MTKYTPKINDLCIFTDGAAKNNKKDTNAGFGIYIPKVKLEYGKYMKGTNNQAELEAIDRSLYLLTKKFFHENTVYICTDSQYCITVINSDKTYSINMDVINECRKYLNIAKKTYNIVFYHVSAHTGGKDFISISNAKADEIASWCAKNKKDYNERTKN